MANQSRVFRLINNVTGEMIVNSLTSFLMTEKHMEVQSSPTTDGYVLQASQPQDGWKTISGTRLAVTVQLVQMGDNINVIIGEGTWSDKIGAGAVGWFVAWPLAVSAGIGAARQKKLPDEIFAMVEKIIMLGGQQIAVTGAGMALKAGEIACPSCKAINSIDSKFCNQCGAILSNACPSCGADIPSGSKFCPKCGTKI